MEKKIIDGACYAEMLKGGTEVLKSHVKEVNDLNVFPIPDGDTGENMLLTITGGAQSPTVDDDLSATAKSIADGMLLSARGNSGVILSQFFDGISHGFEMNESADEHLFEEAFKEGVKYAYKAVLNPTEGTILTVIREATDYAAASGAETPEQFLEAFTEEAKRALERTPELLPVLKKAGVVDSGGAGIVYIAEGMRRALSGEVFESAEPSSVTGKSLDYSAFGEDSELVYGYCTELLVRLQRAKTDVEAFDEKAFTQSLEELGDSVVTVKRGSILKVHVHTKRPSEVLELCHRYGEFLNVKIENMSLQHGSLSADFPSEEASDEELPLDDTVRSVAVANGTGIIEAFREMGADVVIDGGHSMNPSAEDFVCAFKKTHSRSIVVFPNNSNSVLAAKQAAALFSDAEIRVVESRSVGEGYAALSILDTTLGDLDEIAEQCESAIKDTKTAEISRCVKNTQMDGFSLTEGEHIAISEKKIIAAGTAFDVFVSTLEKLSASEREVLILIKGAGLDPDASEAMEEYAKKQLPHTELYVIDGGQDVYDLIIVSE
ncbi:MAG: DAK2 domain-containing protein [Clostridia bacterium]|nr:DAK2 domain-containing protein [Clostridia bacterium]